VKKRERQEKSRIYCIPCKRRRRNQQSEQTNLEILQQALPIKNKMIVRTYSRGRKEKKIQSIKVGVSSLANAHDKRAQKDGSHTTDATNIPRPFFHAQITSYSMSFEVIHISHVTERYQQIKA